MTRLPLVPADSDDPRLAEAFDAFRARGRDVPTLYRTLGNAPAMLQAWTAFAWPLRHEAVTSRRLRELMIMRIAQTTRAPYEWWGHHAMAIAEGITEAQLAALSQWSTSDLFDDDERLVLAIADEVTVDLEVADDTWAVLMQRFDAEAAVELVLTAAFYNCVSRVLRTIRLDVDLDDPRLTHF